ncbi:MAG TPA: HU family DNA-binding protein, partial [Chthoniobacterales bacterium]
MTKIELQAALAEATHTDKKTVGALLTALGQIAYKTVKKEGECALPGFGKLVKQKRAARTGFNPRTRQKVKVAAKTVIRFRVAKDAILGAKAPPDAGPQKGKPSPPPVARTQGKAGPPSASTQAEASTARTPAQSASRDQARPGFRPGSRFGTRRLRPERTPGRGRVLMTRTAAWALNAEGNLRAGLTEVPAAGCRYGYRSLVDHGRSRSPRNRMGH